MLNKYISILFLLLYITSLWECFKIYWITTQIGIKTWDEEIKEEDFGAVIIDLRDIKADGTNDITKFAIKLQNVFNTIANRKVKFILQDDANLEVATAFVCGIFLWGMQIKVEDTIEFVGMKIKEITYSAEGSDPVRSINVTLNDEFKESLIKALGLLLYG